MKTSETIKEIAAALAKAQGAIKGAPKTSENPFFNSSYADLESVREAIRVPLSENGLAFVQDVATADGGQYYLSAKIMHISGEYIEFGPMRVPAKEGTPQAVKSAVTYMRRTQILSMFGMSEADDDAEAAEGRQQPKKPMKQQGPPPDVFDLPPDVGSYEFKFGKFKGQKLKDISQQDLTNYCNYIVQKAEMDQKPIQGTVKEALDMANAYLGERGEIE